MAREQPPVDASLVEATASRLTPRMLRVSAAMGVGAAIGLALTLVRTKLVAVELGPEGVGALSLLVAFLGLAALMIELGVGNAAIRDVAAADAAGRNDERDALRRALFVVVCTLGAVGATAIAVLAGPLARTALGDDGFTEELRVAAIAAFATVVGAGALAELNAFRRIRALALVQPMAGLLATAATGLAVVLDGDVLLVALIAPPVAIAAVALLRLRGLPPRGSGWRPAALGVPARRLVGLGVAFVANAGAAALGLLLVRLLIDDELGRTATGEFQAAYAVVATYVAFLLAALTTDYMPLLSRHAHDAGRMNRIADTQLLVVVAIAVPAIACLTLLAPAVVPLLYSGEFDRTVDALRIMLLGDLGRVAAWTVGYILIARDARRRFVGAEVLYNLVVVAATAALVGPMGLDGAAVAYAAAQLPLLAWTLLLVRRTSGYRLTAASRNALAAGGLATLAIFAGVEIGGAGTVGATAIAALCVAVAVSRLAALSQRPIFPLRRR